MLSIKSAGDMTELFARKASEEATQAAQEKLALEAEGLKP